MITVSNEKHWLIEHAELRKDQLAVLTGNTRLSYNDLVTKSLKMADYLKQRGIKRNDHIAMLIGNNLDFIVALNGLWFIGAIPIPLNVNLNIQELKKLIKDSHCKAAIVENDHFYDLIINDLQVININYENEKQNFKKFNLIDFSGERTCLMLFTSGTTGSPKCVQFTFNNLYSSCKSADKFIIHNSEDIWLASLPFYHIGGLSIFTRSILSGCRLVIPDSQKEKNIYRSMKQYKPTLISMVPTMLKNLIESPLNPWKELKYIFIGGGPISSALIQNALDKSWPVTVVYGSTETSSMVSICSVDNFKKNGLSAGIPLEGVEILISKGDKYDRFPDSFGSITIISKSVSNSYYNLSTSENQQLNGGIYFSNDIGKIDSKDNLQVLGRKDDIIISGGENISLKEIESILRKEECFNECIALGVNDNKWGESYIIICDSKEMYIQSKIESYLQNKIARFKLPQNIYILDEIPRNELGKIQMNELKKIIKADFL